jgi:diguanylate cyclase (GGDEF)-like protein
LLLQSAIALSYCAGVYAGLFGAGGASRVVAVAWIGSYHAFHAWYVLTHRARGRRVRWIETITPLCDISCVTLGWIALGDPGSAIWVVYVYALVGYARRIHGRWYFALAAFITLNLVAAKTWLSVDAGESPIDANVLIMLLLTAAIASLANLIGTAWRRAELQARTLAQTDPLTGIDNRRTFLSAFDELARAPENGFSVLMLDLDDFKRLNDAYGHLHGDEVLVDVARLLSFNIREEDLLARYGGEEFVIAMPGTGAAEAQAVAERLRAAVCGATPTSVSIGCATRRPGEPAESVLRRADDLLLAAKRQGKNAVRALEPLLKTA